MAASGSRSPRATTCAAAWSGADRMGSLFAFTVIGLFTGAAYAIAASGLVLTYTTTRVFNIAHGAFGMILAFTFWDFSVRQGLPVWLSMVLVLLVVAPAIGWFISRRSEEHTPELQSLMRIW